ncbi:MAG: hypothetical protein Kow0069_21880 [Promethearchaeota archaeon]
MVEDDRPPAVTPGEQKILDFFNDRVPVNEPVSLREVTEATGLSWTYVKRVVTSGKFTVHAKKSGKTWIAWKTASRVGVHHDDTCAKYLIDEVDERDG